MTITLGGKLGTAKVKDGRFVVTRTVPRSLSGKAVLRNLDRKGEVLGRIVVQVIKRKKAPARVPHTRENR